MRAPGQWLDDLPVSPPPFSILFTGERRLWGENLADYASHYASSIAWTRNGGSGPSGNGTGLPVTLALADVLVRTITKQRE